MAESYCTAHNRRKINWAAVVKAGDFETGSQVPHPTTNPLDLDIESNTDSNIDPVLQSTGLNNACQASDPIEYDTSDIDNTTENSQVSQSQSVSCSVQPSDSISQVPSNASEGCSWVYSHFEPIVLIGKTYLPKGAQKEKPDIRRKCKHCTSWSALDSEHYETSNISQHLQTEHRIIKDSNPTYQQTSVLQLLTMQKPKTVHQIVTVDQALSDWIVDTLQPFTVVEKSSWKRLWQAAGTQLPYLSGNTVHWRIFSDFEKCRQYLITNLEQTCSTISLALDR